MLTELGKFLRKLRIDRGELIKDMAGKLGVTASYVSAVETGKRSAPRAWENKISRLYGLDRKAKSDLSAAVERSAKILKLSLDAISDEKKDAALLFAREFSALDESDIIQINQLINKLSKSGGADR
jgi:transcriptional regulator with XRE-family HTH domain